MDDARTYEIQGVRIELEDTDDAFVPSRNGGFYASTLRVQPGERVIDIGTGSGILAIFAAKRGGIVSATETDAISVEVARRNYERNGVAVDLSHGSMFADSEGPFDVIIANLPNEILPPEDLRELGPVDARLIHGGRYGNERILELIRQAPRYMHARTRLYLPVHTLTDYNEVLRRAVEAFDARLLAVGDLPAKHFVHEHIDWYRPLDEAGIIRIFRRDDTWYTNGYVFECTLRGA